MPIGRKLDIEPKYKGNKMIERLNRILVAAAIIFLCGGFFVVVSQQASKPNPYPNYVPVPAESVPQQDLIKIFKSWLPHHES
jgi:hypothetical protein